MRSALIAPTIELPNFEHADKIHLTLAHLVRFNAYRTFYIGKKVAGDYIIIDNSAHEFRIPVTPGMLIARAVQLRADEIVIPDVPYNGRQTLDLASQAIDTWSKEHRKTMEAWHFNFMLVPQGNTLQEWRTCLFGLILKLDRAHREWPDLYSRANASVIGLPAKYENKFGPGTVRDLISKFLAPAHFSRGYDVHLLGLREMWGLNDLATEFPWIRSIDSAKPIVYAKSGIVWDPLHEVEPEHITRPDGFFEWELTDHQRAVALQNERVFRNLAKGKYKGYKK